MEGAKTEGRSVCCDDHMDIVRSGFQVDFIQCPLPSQAPTLHAKAANTNILQASVHTPTERQTPESKQRLIMEYLIILTREQNIYVELFLCKEAAEFVFRPGVRLCSTPSP